MADTTATRSHRFEDWRLALRSIIGFWALYMVTVVVRAFLGQDPTTVLLNKSTTIGVGILLTVLIYVAMNLFAFRSSWRRRAIVAVGASFLAACALSGILIALDRYQEKPTDEIHYVTADGYEVTEFGDRMRIDRPGENPLVLNWPKIDRLEPWVQFRFAADNAVIWFFFFAAWTAFYLALVAQARTHQLKHRAAIAEAAAQQAQIRALRYQVNPHFLFNTLNSLSSLIMTNRNERAEEMLLAISTFFRTSLSLDPNAEVTLAEEIELQRLYLDIEKVRFPTRLNVEIDVPDSLLKAKLPALILQPLIENAIKYGVSRSKEKVTIRIVAERTPDGDLALSVTNSGKVDEAPSTDHGTGVGLKNVEQRLNARYGSAAKSRFGPKAEGGYEVHLVLPLEIENG